MPASTRAFSSAASRAIWARMARATGWEKGKDFVIEGDEYDSAYFDKTAKFLKYLPDIAVDQQRRVRSRRHLRRHRCGSARVPPPGEPRAAIGSAAARRGLPRRAGAEESRGEPGRDVRPRQSRPIGARPMSRCRPAGQSFNVLHGGSPYGDDADSVVRPAQCSKRDGVDRRGARAIDTGGHDCRGSAAVRRRQAPAGDLRTRPAA